MPIAVTYAGTGEATHPSMVTRNNQGRFIVCKICAKTFNARGPGSYTYCSRACRTTGNTALHRTYAQHNREHLNQYARERYLAQWGKSNKEIALKAEKFAFSKLLPSLGFTEIYDVTKIRRFVPFDFIATDQGSRVLIDITTARSKCGYYRRTATSLANALRMKLLIVFIKPDFSAYMIRDSSEGAHILQGQLRPIA